MSKETSAEIASLAGRILATDFWSINFDTEALERFFDTAQRLAGSCLVQYEKEDERKMISPGDMCDA